VRLPNRIHIVGASGSGTTSLGLAMAARYGHRHLDTDDFFWVRTDPPYREKRPREERLALLRQALGETRWVLSGSLCGWGDPLIPEIELVVFLVVPTPVRLERLRVREIGRYGQHAIAPGGDRYAAHVEFLEWAGRYDTGGLEVRSRALHEAWLAKFPCEVVRLEGDLSLVNNSRPSRRVSSPQPAEIINVADFDPWTTLSETPEDSPHELGAA
jgi:adenylate kinase family enzyme